MLLKRSRRMKKRNWYKIKQRTRAHGIQAALGMILSYFELSELIL